MQRRWLTGIEIVVSIVAATLFTFALPVKADPINRIGQVSGLATIAFRLLVVSIPLVGALVVSARVRGGAAFDTVARFVCAAFAGLTSATFAAGIVFALRGTEYGLGGTIGDVGVLCQWADSIKAGDSTWSSVYPPLQVHLLLWLSEWMNVPTTHAMKMFQVLGVLAMGPAAYAAWRLLLRPGWALGVTVVTVVVIVEPYRPYAGLVLVVLLPLLLKFLDVLQNVGTLPLQRVMQYAAIFGVGLGLLCLLYSGWYQWSAPGFVVAALIVFPWRDWRRGALFSGIAAVLFGLCVVRYVMGFAAGTGIKDKYFYVDALIEPTYFAMWRGGNPADTKWQPLGELGGIGVFTLLLAVGLAIAMTHGRRNSSVIALVSIVTGCWLFRLWHAHNMWATKLVQLWPRTSQEILCGMLVLCVFAVYLVVQRAKPTSTWRSPWATIGAVTSLMLVIMSASSATTDQYLATDVPRSPGELAWNAHNMSQRKPSVARGAKVVASSSLETAEYSARALTDGDHHTYFSTALGNTEDHEEWIEIQFDDTRRFSRVLLFPAPDGFPIDFAIDVWDGSKWLTRREVLGAAEPYRLMAVAISPDRGRELTSKVRIRATRLRLAAGTNNYVLRLAEIELR